MTSPDPHDGSDADTVVVRDLSMRFRVPVRADGLRAAFRSLGRREYRDVDAVDGLDFRLGPGEIVGFLGPNGAGKTTTMKILAGILHPTAGTARVLGHTPWQRRPEYLRRIAFVRGSRPISGPEELTVRDTFRFQRLLYRIPDADYRAALAELDDLLDLGPLLDRQLRGLSLGQRMRAGLAAILLYRPRVLFLDEPTLGLDVTAAAALRRHIAGYVRTTSATVLLTSHHMTDVEVLCPRVMLIDRGRLHHDGPPGALADALEPERELRVQVEPAGGVDWSRYGRVDDPESASEAGVLLRVDRAEVPRVTAALLSDPRVMDLSVAEPPLEDVMERALRGRR